jgi:hypothetical protein
VGDCATHKLLEGRGREGRTDVMEILDTRSDNRWISVQASTVHGTSGWESRTALWYSRNEAFRWEVTIASVTPLPEAVNSNTHSNRSPSKSR